MALNGSQNSKPKRRKPLGKLPPLSDDELAALAVVTPQDIEAAKARWRGSVKPRYVNLLDAEQVSSANP